MISELVVVYDITYDFCIYFQSHYRFSYAYCNAVCHVYVLFKEINSGTANCAARVVSYCHNLLRYRVNFDDILSFLRDIHLYSSI